MGLVYGDPHLVAVGSTFSAMEIAQTWWYVREEKNIHTQEFTRKNCMVRMDDDDDIWVSTATLLIQLAEIFTTGNQHEFFAKVVAIDLLDIYAPTM